jgi:hypothetical protein
MSKVYFPIRYEDVPASPPHGDDPAYRVSFGIEHWGDGSAEHVYKVQMVYGGTVAGRKSPSYPEDSDDFDRVLDAMRRIKAGGGRNGRGMTEAVGDEPGMPIADAHNLLAALE